MKGVYIFLFVYGPTPSKISFDSFSYLSSFQQTIYGLRFRGFTQSQSSTTNSLKNWLWMSSFKRSFTKLALNT
jgi:hypothetical protein